VFQYLLCLCTLYLTDSVINKAAGYIIRLPPFKCVGRFQNRYEFASFSANQIYALGPRHYIFNLVPNSERFSPFKMHGEISKSILVNRKRAELMPNLKSPHAFKWGIACQFRHQTRNIKSLTRSIF